MNIVDRIRSLCREQGSSITKLEVALGFGNGSIGRWKDSSPSYERLKAVAEYLGVTIEYLAEGTEKSSLSENSELSEKEHKFLAGFRELQPHEQDMMIAQMEGLQARAERNSAPQD
jgi:transcriptional regulator with XRE-family HTH domain